MARTVTLLVIAACCLGVSDARPQRTLLENEDYSKTAVTDFLGCGFSILKAAIAEAGLSDALNDPKADVTVFAPTNKAFKAALAQLGITQEELLKSDDLADILKYHVVPGKIVAADIPEGITTKASLLGPEITITNDEDGIAINDASVEYADLKALNGVVHVIDKVLLPPATRSQSNDAEPEPESERESEPEPEAESEPESDSRPKILG